MRNGSRRLSGASAQKLLLAVPSLYLAGRMDASCMPHHPLSPPSFNARRPVDAGRNGSGALILSVVGYSEVGSHLLRM